VSINCIERFGRSLDGARRPPRLSVWCFAPLILLSALETTARTRASPGAVPDNSYIGDRACQQCHAGIYESFLKTAMARASGPAKGSLIPGDFNHAASHVHYRVFEASGHAWLSFDREGSYAIHDRRELLYFIGSGRRGRTYIFAKEGFFFESPINWYGQQRLWDMTPAYQGSKHTPLLPAWIATPATRKLLFRVRKTNTPNRSFLRKALVANGVTAQAQTMRRTTERSSILPSSPRPGGMPSACSATWKGMLQFNSPAIRCGSFARARTCKITFTISFSPGSYEISLRSASLKRFGRACANGNQVIPFPARHAMILIALPIRPTKSPTTAKSA